MAHVSHRLSGSIEGALAGGGDPATSPLYVFGPFLRLIVVGGVAHVTFGASIWLAVISVVTVSAMYRLVMIWVTDGSGGSGLNEEEFGPWAVKVNAGITVVEYTLTFLVSIAALVTFLSDRFPALNGHLAGVPIRTLIAIVLSVATGFAVNRGPRVAARTFGPATAAVLLLLWAMIAATVWRFGLRLPTLQWEAFSPRYLEFTLNGYARILALMTGIEIFANLVSAYEGTAAERSRKAFGSLVIVMGTTSLTMLIVGPAILTLADPLDPAVSVFTQTMDRLLPGPLAYAGTLIGIAVLLSAAAASAQGLQNLSLGLRYRHYVPAWLGQRNRFGVADKPVWLEVAVCTVCFAVFGTHEETYLALYAAGVFVLLTLTGWAAIKRLGREARAKRAWGTVAALVGTLIAALLTTSATVIIFAERFAEGAWAYLVLIPILFGLFSIARRRLGVPLPVEDRLGLLLSASSPAGLGQPAMVTGAPIANVLVPLDREPESEHAFPIALTLARAFGAKLTVLSVLETETDGARRAAEDYLAQVAVQLGAGGQGVEARLSVGAPPEQIAAAARSGAFGAIVLTTRGRAKWQRWLAESTAAQVMHETTPPLIVVRPTEDWRSVRSRGARLLVALDGSELAEQVLPFVVLLAPRLGSQVHLLSVREGGDSDQAPEKLEQYLDRIQAGLRRAGVEAARTIDDASPAEAIVRVARERAIDLILVVSHGRGGIERQQHVKLGSVVEHLAQHAPCPIFMVSAVPTAK